MMRYRFLATITIAGCMTAGTALRAAEDAPAKPPATSPSSQPDQAGVNRFYGVITAVDSSAMTFVVDEQTYHVTGESHMTKAADDKMATLADAVVGEPARGTYTKAADGRMNVTKVRFGKKAGGGKSGGKKKQGDAAPASSQPHS